MSAASLYLVCILPLLSSLGAMYTRAGTESLRHYEVVRWGRESALTASGWRFWRETWPHRTLLWPVKNIVDLSTACLTRYGRSEVMSPQTFELLGRAAFTGMWYLNTSAHVVMGWNSISLNLLRCFQNICCLDFEIKTWAKPLRGCSVQWASCTFTRLEAGKGGWGVRTRLDGHGEGADHHLQRLYHTLSMVFSLINIKEIEAGDGLCKISLPPFPVMDSIQPPLRFSSSFIDS